jgi:hypothetical protein
MAVKKERAKASVRPHLVARRPSECDRGAGARSTWSRGRACEALRAGPAPCGTRGQGAAGPRR